LAHRDGKASIPFIDYVSWTPRVAWLIGQGRRRNSQRVCNSSALRRIFCVFFLTPHLTLSISDPSPCSGSHPNDGPAACPWYLTSSLSHSTLITTFEKAADTHKHTAILYLFSPTAAFSISPSSVLFHPCGFLS
jgi:hypothetical protein